jgi:hypothetical protein
MANTDNSCSGLEVTNHYVEGADTLTNIMEIQADTQKNVYGYDFDNMSLREIMIFWHMNNHSLIDEIHEATDALGGINDGSGSAIWKRWKKDFSKFENMKFSDLSPNDQLECKFEIIDMLHFFMNYAISIGMSGREMYNLYMAKNAENRARQERGY